MAAHVAVMRQVQNLKLERQRGHLASEDADGWGCHIEGACGELAVAKCLNKFWSGQIGDIKAGDVGDVEVRTTVADNNRLIIHPGDPDHRPFILVIGKPRTYRIAGWIMGRDGKRPEYWTDPKTGRPAFFVPQAALRPIAELPR